MLMLCETPSAYILYGFAFMAFIPYQRSSPGIFIIIIVLLVVYEFISLWQTEGYLRPRKTVLTWQDAVAKGRQNMRMMSGEISVQESLFVDEFALHDSGWSLDEPAVTDPSYSLPADLVPVFTALRLSTAASENHLYEAEQTTGGTTRSAWGDIPAGTPYDVSRVFLPLLKALAKRMTYLRNAASFCYHANKVMTHPLQYTDGKYHNRLNVLSGVIVGENNWSPDWYIKSRRQRYPFAAVPRRPPLHRWSDCVWLEWNSRVNILGLDRPPIEWIIHHHIVTQETKAIINLIVEDYVSRSNHPKIL